jgi:ABC-type branched-subunit amino acid transport system substrate-binding protein
MQRLRVTQLLIALLAILAFQPLLSSAGALQPPSLSIGVIGEEDSQTYRGVALVVDKVNADGGLTLPTGETLPLALVNAPATTPAEVNTAVQNFRSQNVVAIFGPDDDLLAAQSLSALAFTGIPVFTAATSNDAKVGGFVFRTQANDDTRMLALVDVLKNDLQASRIAVFQGGAAFAPQAGSFAVALARQQITPATVVLQIEGSTPESSASVALQSQPDTIAAFGTPDQVVALYQAMLNGGFAGTLVTPYADQREFINRLPAANRGNIYGATGWVSAWTSPASTLFTADFVASQGDIPTALAAAAYDGATALVLAMRENGSNPGQILAKMLTTPAFFSVQGEFDPSLGNGDLTQHVMVVRTAPNGAPRLVARFKGRTRLSLDPNEGATVQQPPTPIVAPTAIVPPTLVPSPEPVFVTATPEGVTLTVLNETVNVRGGPGTNYPILGRVLRDQQLRIFGRNGDATWLVINFNGQQAWITGDRSLVSVFGDVNSVPVTQAPPTPQPTATATSAGPTLSPQADVQLVSFVLSPTTLVPGQQFTLTVTVRNGGGTATGEFAVASSFKPGDVFGATIFGSLNPGESRTQTITFPGVQAGAGTYTVAIVLDLNRQVAEGDVGEGNNVINITYNVQ